MATDRRRLLLAGAALPLLGLPGPGTAAPAPRGSRAQRLLACRSDQRGRHHATLLDSRGARLLDIPLPGRGHGFAVSHNDRRAVIFARRPGDFMLAIDLAAQRAVAQIGAASGRHFYGHGAFSADDRLLYATENAYEAGQGRIGVYDVAHGFHRVGELDSHGIGPHEIALDPDGRSLLVAIGGIRTHPDLPRAKLNLNSMRSALVRIDAASGDLLAEHRTPQRWQRLGIRHLDVAPTGQVALALQYEGPTEDRPPLVGLLDRDAVRWLQAPPGVQDAMRNYTGAVRFLADGSGFAVSAPRGGLVTLWAADGSYRCRLNQADACGLAAAGDRLWYSDGLGGLSVEPAGADDRRIAFQDTRWDNHMVALGDGAAD